MDRRTGKPRSRGPRFMSFGLFGPLGALGERMGQGHPLDDFDPEAFQHGAYGNGGAAADPAERAGSAEPGDPAGRPPHESS